VEFQRRTVFFTGRTRKATTTPAASVPGIAPNEKLKF
jgi:hypothetical protein